MKLRIKNHVGKLDLGYAFSREPSKQSKNFAEFANVSPADVNIILMHIDINRVSISKRYAEYFPSVGTF